MIDSSRLRHVGDDMFKVDSRGADQTTKEGADGRKGLSDGAFYQ